MLVEVASEMAKAVLFDLDGTLLPMDFDDFMRSYIYRLSIYTSRQGLRSIRFLFGYRKAMYALMDYDGTRTIREVFWDAFFDAIPNAPRDIEESCMQFFRSDFRAIGRNIRSNIFADATLRTLARKGYRLVLATNPVFPRVATVERCRWARIDHTRFELISTYETFHHLKPDLDYYREVCDRRELDPGDCIMVGNNVAEDMCAEQLGMDTFLVTPYLLNPRHEDTSRFKQGTLAALYRFAQELPDPN